ncbi:uncharacterized protein LOC144113672 [Amblyomma americanum]
MKRLSAVHVLNPEHRFLDASGEPMLSLFAADRYHVARRRGIDPSAPLFLCSGKSRVKVATIIMPLGSLSAATQIIASVAAFDPPEAAQRPVKCSGVLAIGIERHVHNTHLTTQNTRP